MSTAALRRMERRAVDASVKARIEAALKDVEH
jgi:hypothetical protein